MILMLHNLIFSQRKFDSKIAGTFPVNADEVVYSPDGKYYLIRSGKNLTLFDKSGDLKWKTSIGYKINRARFDARGNKIYVTTKKGIFVGKTSNGIFSLFSKIRKVQYISTSTNNKFYAASANRDLILGDQQTGMILKRIDDAHGKKIIFVDFISEDRVITIGGDSIITIWDTDTGKEIKSNKIRSYRIHAAALSFDKKFLFIGAYEPSMVPNREGFEIKEKFKLVIIKITEEENMTFIKEIDGTTEIISSLSISADNKYAAVLKDDNTIDIWGLENGYINHSFSEPEYQDIKFDPSGETVMVSIKNGQIQKWNTKGIVPELARAQYIGEKYAFKSSKEPLISRKEHNGITLAVLDFSANSIDPQIAISVSYFFRTRVVNRPYLRVVERDELKKVLNELGLQNKGITSRKTARRIGKVLNTEKLIMGNVSKLGSTLMISTKIVDTESARIEGARELECQNFALENVPEMVDILIDITIEK
jgi:WD40 repeat protein